MSSCDCIAIMNHSATLVFQCILHLTRAEKHPRSNHEATVSEQIHPLNQLAGTEVTSFSKGRSSSRGFSLLHDAESVFDEYPEIESRLTGSKRRRSLSASPKVSLSASCPFFSSSSPFQICFLGSLAFSCRETMKFELAREILEITPAVLVDLQVMKTRQFEELRETRVSSFIHEIVWKKCKCVPLIRIHLPCTQANGKRKDGEDDAERSSDPRKRDDLTEGLNQHNGSLTQRRRDPSPVRQVVGRSYS
jgi:hypothetical protein